MKNLNLKVFNRYLIRGILCVLTFLIIINVITIKTYGTDEQSGIKEALFEVASAFERIDKHAMEGAEHKRIIYSGIHGMLQTLDPYTQFLEEDTFKFLQEQQQGSFYGIGISFDIRNGRLLVVSPIEDSPAWELGIRAGDIIVEIEGESTAGISTSEVLKKLRGEKGSKVEITVKRPGVSDQFHFDIVRDKIDLTSVRGGFFVDEDIGYVRITEFSATTAQELEDILEKFDKKKLKGLILDLRFNGGGLLSAAEKVTSLFLGKNKLVVSTKGRNDSELMQLKTRREGKFQNIPLVILVNSGSASSSEIVAGAIQDYDRGIIIGTETHGKGLVGSQYPTKLNTSLQITTAQYFTPSGRFIQKPYDIPHRNILNSSRLNTPIPDSKKNEHIYYTEKGRKVYGGGGITPDIIFKEKVLSPNIFLLESQGLFFDFAINYGDKFKDSISPDMEIGADIFQAFLNFIQTKDLMLDKQKLNDTKDILKISIKRDLCSVYLNSEIGEKIRVGNLEIIQKAIEIFPDINMYLNSD